MNEVNNGVNNRKVNMRNEFWNKIDSGICELGSYIRTDEYGWMVPVYILVVAALVWLW